MDDLTNTRARGQWRQEGFDFGFGRGYRLSECNSFYNGGASGVSDAYGTALWAIDFLFLNAQYGSAGTNFHIS